MKTLLLSFVVISMSLIAALAMAQSNSDAATKMPTNGTMSMESSMNQQNMKDMSQLMTNMSDTMKKHKITEEQQVEFARIMSNLANTMMSWASDNELKAVDKHKADIKKITEDWNYFKEGNFEDH
jgi:predicted transglutaminase-like cysteine proteinase